MLQRAGILPSGWFVIPGEGAPLDAYGNVAGSVIVRIASQLQAFGESGYRANETPEQRHKRNRLKKEGRYFAIQPNERGALKPGIYERLGGSHGEISCVFVFSSKAPSYRARYPFTALAQEFAKPHFAQEFESALRQAVATAR